jgi:putative transposase
MPRTARASLANYCYHVFNRGNRRAEVFHKPDDYEAFVALLAEAGRRVPMRVLAYCVMPDHFHLVLRPTRDGDLSRWMQWLMTAHVRRYHRLNDSDGHVWQGRFKAFPIQEDDHLLTVLRYVESNPLRAGLVPRAEDWSWSSLCAFSGGSRRGRALALDWLDPGSVPRGRRWAARVNRPMTEAELDSLRRSVRRGTPFGAPDWQAKAAAAMGLESSLRPRGRPRKAEK